MERQEGGGRGGKRERGRGRKGDREGGRGKHQAQWSQLRTSLN